MSNVISNFFGEAKIERDHQYGYSLYDFKVNGLGKWCGVDRKKLEVHLDLKRSLLARLTDILLIDPQGRLANAIGRPRNRYQEYDIKCAEKDIFCRKVSSAILLIVPFMLWLDADRYGIDSSLLKGAAGMQIVVFLFVTSSLVFLKYCMRY